MKVRHHEDNKGNNMKETMKHKSILTGWFQDKNKLCFERTKEFQVFDWPRLQ